MCFFFILRSCCCWDAKYALNCKREKTRLWEFMKALAWWHGEHVICFRCEECGQSHRSASTTLKMCNRYLITLPKKLCTQNIQGGWGGNTIKCISLTGQCASSHITVFTPNKTHNRTWARSHQNYEKCQTILSNEYPIKVCLLIIVSKARCFSYYFGALSRQPMQLIWLKMKTVGKNAMFWIIGTPLVELIHTRVRDSSSYNFWFELLCWSRLLFGPIGWIKKLLT